MMRSGTIAPIFPSHILRYISNMQPNAYTVRVDMNPAAKSMVKVSVADIARESGRGVRGLYELRKRRPEVYGLLADGVRYRRMVRLWQG